MACVPSSKLISSLREAWCRRMSVGRGEVGFKPAMDEPITKKVMIADGAHHD
jgi:hypothetical protein